MADALREQLLSGMLAPGTPIRDGDLSAQAGVSRTTVREALTLLAREGLLTHSLHRGMEVARLAPDDVHDIYAMRRLLERAGAEALIVGDGASMEPLAEAVADMARAGERRDARRVVEADVAFHSAIVAALGNARLQQAMRRGMMELRLVLSVTDRAYDGLDAQLHQHQRLLESIQRRSPDTLRTLEAHLAHAEAMVCAALLAADDAGARSTIETASTERPPQPEVRCSP